MDTLQKNNYDLAKAMSTLVPQGGPVLCRDEMEEWSASEAMLFEEALEKYGKDFNDIRQDFVSSLFLLNVRHDVMSTLNIVSVTVYLDCSVCGLVQYMFSSSASLEVSSQCGPVLLHVEDY